jgi:hypothetical protein
MSFFCDAGGIDSHVYSRKIRRRILTIPKKITTMSSRMKLFSTFCIVFAGLALLVFASFASAANNGKGPCAGDISQFCSGVQPGGGRIIGCLEEHQADLSASCQKKIAKFQKRRNRRKACHDDAARFCQDVQPGGGRIIQCLNDHSADLSSGCQDLLSHIRR